MFKTTVEIDGMACGMCEAHVCDTFRSKLNIKKVSASARKGTAEIISEEEIPERVLKDALDPTGYRVLSASSVPYEKKKLFGRK